MYLTVPTPPRGLILRLAQEDPPVVQASWQQPQETYGEVTGYRLRYLIQGSRDSDMVERPWEKEIYRFSTGYLGTDTPLLLTTVGESALFY